MSRDEYAIYVPSPNMWPGRMGYTPKFIIDHGTASTAESTISWFQNPESEVSANYLVTQTGKIIQFVDEDKSAWGNGVLSEGHDVWWSNDTNPNLICISIEHEKPDNNNNTPLTAAQALATFQLHSRICQRWNIPTRPADANGGITGHYSIDPVHRSFCPNVFPWAGLFDFLNQTNGDNLDMLSLASGMGQFFQDLGGGVWLCKKNHVRFVGDNLKFYRKHEGAGGLPLTGEIELEQFKGTRLVICERWIQVFDPTVNGKRMIDNPPIPASDTVYLLHIDDRSLGQQIICKSLVANLNTEISNLNAQLASVKAELATTKSELAASQSASVIDALNKRIVSYQTALHQIVVIATQTEAI